MIKKKTNRQSFHSAPFSRCLLEKDPIAQKHQARISRLRGTYDRYGNRIPPECFSRPRKTRPSSSTERDMLESEDDDVGDNLLSSLHPPPPPRRSKKPPRAVRRSYHHQKIASSSSPSPLPKQKQKPPQKSTLKVGGGGRKTRPKSAPKNRAVSRGSPVPEVDEYSSDVEESSEADIPLPNRLDEDETSSEASSSGEDDEDEHEEKKGSSQKVRPR